jgi:hypothetical protein
MKRWHRSIMRETCHIQVMTSLPVDRVMQMLEMECQDLERNSAM